MALLPQPVAQCVGALWAAGWPAYPVGGCVRDLLLGRTPGDWDITTAASPGAVQALFPETRPTGVKHGTVTVLLGGMALEVTTFRADGAYSDGRHPDAVTFGVSLEGDLARRDFTVNAMALSPQGEVIDPFGGRADLAARLIRAVGDPARRFTEDALRMFRAVRFAAQLDFALDGPTAAAIPPLSRRSALVSGERIKAEVEKTLLTRRPDLTGLLLDFGLLAAPRRGDLTSLRVVEPAPIPRWRAFCTLTGFDITSLPVERALKNAVLHPEREAVAGLALSGGELRALGFSGAAIGAAQRALAAHVAHHPEDNTPQRLAQLARTLPSAP